MKYAKTAALVAGSVAALGAAAPAFAATTPTAPNFSLDSGLNQVMASAPQVVDPVVGTVAETAETVSKDGTVGKLAGQATGVAESAAPLLGGVPLGG
ncbi:hypothetical protein ACIQUZ_10010 [Streptomyces griseus]|uniref:hypothetical protein n=1 Tax=Streptomyces TaxID=1883 RepID=UPI0002DCD11E|nr:MULTISPECIES: hypothetical protein [Streptomyces]MYR14476.1 hypothetical protein [Streptomyces sp. SID724]MYR49043.1 hypothetical protein [Streptomyces sp. SID4928]MYT79520.1 hypothetical protein [Streptomyces sp. SID8364]MBW3703849.1 hypothetical protein [Streptomyces griseus]NEB57114.1 hypothetical protein [Streptomyces griseus]